MGALLSWAAEEGFQDFAEWVARMGVSFDYRSAQEFRSRHLTNAVAAALRSMSPWR